MSFVRQSILAGTGRVVSNIVQPPSGCCRTVVEIFCIAPGVALLEPWGGFGGALR
jgi:hypothetical protein